MKIKILLACIVTSFVATLVNYFISKSIEGQGAGLIIYQFIAVIFVSLVIGILFAMESSDFESNKQSKQTAPKNKPKQTQGKSAWE